MRGRGRGGGFVGSWECGDGVGCGVELVRAVRVGVELRRCERLGDGGRCGFARSDVRDDGGGVGAAVEGWWVADGGRQGAAGRRRLRVVCGSGAGRPLGQVDIGGERNAVGSAALPLNAWSHLAATYDGAVVRLFVNGVQAGSLAFAGSMAASTGSLRLGGNSVWGEWFAGLIDEVRVYNRALSASEIQQDMQTPVGGSPPPPDTTPPSAPSGLAASTAVGSATLSWTAVDRQRGVVRYNVHRSTTAGFTPATANRIAQPTGTSYTDSGLAAGTYYYRVTAEDAAGNISAPSTELAVTVPPPPDTAPPSAPRALHGVDRGRLGDRELDGFDRQRRRRPLQRAPLDDGRLHAGDRQPRRPAHRHELHRLGACGRHLLLPGDGRGRGRQRQRSLRRAHGDSSRRRRHRRQRAGGGVWVECGLGGRRWPIRRVVGMRARCRVRCGARRAGLGRR